MPQSGYDPVRGLQRRFVLWWDAQTKHPGGRPGGNSSQDGKGFSKIADFGIDYSTTHRWRQKLVVRNNTKDLSKRDAGKPSAEWRRRVPRLVELAMMALWHRLTEPM